jgi:predicted outer membrane repeat protein
VTNSTFSGNSANHGGAIYWSGNPLGPIGHPVTVTNTIFSNSTGGNCHVNPDSIIVGGTGNTGVITNGGHNLEDGESCGFRTANGSLSSTNALLDPTGLQNNGGPTQTIALEPGSPAIDSGDQAVCAAAPVNDLDQRGFARPGTGATNCSIGAIEFYPPPTARPTPSRTPTPTLPLPTRTPTRTPTLGPCVGDCDHTGKVAVNELVRGVNIALNRAPLDQCPEFDCNGNERVTVDCLVKAVNAALNGCAG